MPLPTTKLSKTLLIETLKKTQEQLLSDPNTQIELLLDIQVTLDLVRFDNDAEAYWSHWLSVRGNTELETFDDAKSLFMAGFNFCQEQFEYEFNSEC